MLRMLSGAIPSTWALALAFFGLLRDVKAFGRNVPVRGSSDGIEAW